MIYKVTENKKELEISEKIIEEWVVLKEDTLKSEWIIYRSTKFKKQKNIE